MEWFHLFIENNYRYNLAILKWLPRNIQRYGLSAIFDSWYNSADQFFCSHSQSFQKVSLATEVAVKNVFTKCKWTQQLWPNQIAEKKTGYRKQFAILPYKKREFPWEPAVCYTAVFRVVTQRNGRSVAWRH